MNWLLLVVIIIIAGCMFNGYKKGLIKTVFTVAAFVISIILVGIFAPLTANVLNRTTLPEKIKVPILEYFETSEDNLQLEQYMDIFKMPQEIHSSILQLQIGEKSSSVAQSTVLVLNEKAAEHVTSQIILILAYLITFIIINVCFFILGIVLNIFTKLPIIKGVNKLAGVGLGFMIGIGCVWVLFLIITAMGMTSFGQDCFFMIQESKVLKALYESNLLMTLI